MTHDELKIQAMIDQVSEENPEAMTMDGHDNAIIGICRHSDHEALLAYSRQRILLNLFTVDGMSMQEAVEYFEETLSGTGFIVIVED